MRHCEGRIGARISTPSRPSKILELSKHHLLLEPPSSEFQTLTVVSRCPSHPKHSCLPVLPTDNHHTALLRKVVILLKGTLPSSSSDKVRHSKVGRLLKVLHRDIKASHHKVHHSNNGVLHKDLLQVSKVTDHQYNTVDILRLLLRAMTPVHQPKEMPNKTPQLCATR